MDKGKCLSSFEGNHHHPVAIPGRNGNGIRSNAADPGTAADLNFLQGFVVVNMLRFLGPVEVVGSAYSVKIDEVFDDMIKRKDRLVSVEIHLRRGSVLT